LRMSLSRYPEVLAMGRARSRGSAEVVQLETW
jgi:hypothetical protein